MKSKLLTKKSLIPAALAVILLVGGCIAVNQTIVADRKEAMAYQKEYAPKNSNNGQFLISFEPGESGNKLAKISSFEAGFYDFKVADTPHEYNGIPIVEVEEEAYSEFPNLEKVLLPQTIESIGKRAFANCENLKEVYIPSSVQKISDDAFNGSKKVTLYVEKGSYAEKFAQKKSWRCNTTPRSR